MPTPRTSCRTRWSGRTSAIDRFDGRYPRAWLLTILRNTHINRNRRRRPELLRDPDTQLERLAQSVETDERTRPDRLVDLELDADVEAALQSLGEIFAEVIELVDIDGLSYAEAAEVLGVPVGTVMSRLHRARKKIREHLRRSGAAPTHADLDDREAPMIRSLFRRCTFGRWPEVRHGEQLTCREVGAASAAVPRR